MIHIDQAALDEALLLKKNTYHNQMLRLYLDGKGCDGFYYGVSFDEPTNEDLEFTHGDLKIIVDPETYKFTKDSTITWVDDDRGRGFLIENPHHRKFRGKFYKKEGWQDKLS